MANSAEQNVLFCDTDDTTYAGIRKIRSIKYIGNTNGTAVIKFQSSSGDVLWQESGASNVYNPDLCIVAPQGIHVAITNGAKVYIYLE
jgi:hypothetical protein